MAVDDKPQDATLEQPEDGGPSPLTVANAKHATLLYATMRIGIFVVSLGVLWGIVAATGHVVTTNGSLYLVMGALLLSGAVSFFLLNRQRDAVSAQLTRRAERMTKRIT